MLDPARHVSIPTILIVDDDPTSRMVLQSILKKEGFVVLTAVNGREGREVAERELPDLIIMDIQMPEENGLVACATLKTNPRTSGIPVVFIAATAFEDFGRAFRLLGDLLSEESGAEALARYSDEAVALASGNAAEIKRTARPVRVYYGEGKSGLQTVGAGTLHSQTIEKSGAHNVALLSGASATGGNQVSLEQLLLWDPDLIIMGYGATAAVVNQDPVWQELRAVKQGRVYSIPSEPYGWLGRPPSVNRLIGLYWLGSLCYPDLYPADALPERVRTFYRLFYHYDLSAAELDAFLGAVYPTGS